MSLLLYETFPRLPFALRIKSTHFITATDTADLSGFLSIQIADTCPEVLLACFQPWNMVPSSCLYTLLLHPPPAKFLLHNFPRLSFQGHSQLRPMAPPHTGLTKPHLAGGQPSSTTRPCTLFSQYLPFSDYYLTHPRAGLSSSPSAQCLLHESKAFSSSFPTESPKSRSLWQRVNTQYMFGEQTNKQMSH